MPYTKNDYPVSMKNLDQAIRNKAIDILNTLLDKENMDEGIAIPTAISRAKDWAANQGKNVQPSNTDSKDHGKDQYVIPHEKGWAVKSEGSEKAAEVFEIKKEAVSAAKTRAKKHHSTLTIQRRDGTVEDKFSYNRN